MASSISPVSITFNAQGVYLDWTCSENISKDEVSSLFEKSKFDIWRTAVSTDQSITFKAPRKSLTCDAISNICSAVKTLVRANDLYNIGQKMKEGASREFRASPVFRKMANVLKLEDSIVSLEAFRDLDIAMEKTGIAVEMLPLEPNPKIIFYEE